MIANHECALDFVNLIGLTRTPMHFVISYTIFNTLPVRGLASRLGLIPKQQFQTRPSDLMAMRSVLAEGRPLVIYPAGLMCEDGLTTPIPDATYKFIKWLGVDVYAARTSGSYLVMPKWAKHTRPGRTDMDVYKLIDRDKLPSMDEAEIRSLVDGALLFDAYREQEASGHPSSGFREIGGLENVLYMCPSCGAEGTVSAKDDTIFCTACGFTEKSDSNAVLHKCGGPGAEVRYVSDWSTSIREHIRAMISDGSLRSAEGDTKLQLLDLKHKRFVDAGAGHLTLTRGQFRFRGVINGEKADITIPLGNIPTLPFKPGHHIEVQNGNTVYRFLPENKKLMQKFVNMVELFHESETAGNTAG